MPSRRIQDCIPELQEVWNKALTTWLRINNTHIPILTCTYRPQAEQDRIYASGRTKPGKILTKVRFSKHTQNPARAFDFTFLIKGTSKYDWNNIDNFTKFWNICKSINPNLRWGGYFSFKDFGHIEI